MKFFLSTFILALALSFTAQAADTLRASERLITLLATNDIHGGVEPTAHGGQKPMGGMAIWSGIAHAIRAGLQKQYGTQAGVLTVDAGDQFQGTLISNLNKGQLVFATMKQVGYDAIVPGNHDYDFGPADSPEDQSSDPSKRREALERLAQQVNFPLLSANTFLLNSLADSSGKAVEAEGKRCKPKAGSKAIDWTRARALDFLKPYVILPAAGVRVALIGIDNPFTPETTTEDNVSDLCFGDEAEHYLRVRHALEGQADVFVLIIHNGNTGNQHDLTTLVSRISAAGPHTVDAVVSGHTHYNYNETMHGIPVIQSGYGGVHFGRIDLVWDLATKKLVPAKTKSWGGLYILADGCDKKATFCKLVSKTPNYEGVGAKADPAIVKLIANARKEIAPIAGFKVGEADQELKRDRIAESALSNAMTDAFRDASRADIAWLNTGGLRDNLYAGKVTYEDLFRVVPFNNHAIVMGPMPTEKVVALLQRSISTCGSFGALMQSGLRVSFTRHCDSSQSSGVDKNAKLVRVEDLQGHVLYDQGAGVHPREAQGFKIATLDFLVAGGSGFDGFKGVPTLQDLGIMRDLLKTAAEKEPYHWTGELDGRWKLVEE